MGSMITLANVKLVLTGALGRDAEDVKWALIARGASVLASVTKTTGAVVAGANPNGALVNKAKALGVPVLDLAALGALLDGATLADAVAGRSSGGASVATLAGKKVGVAGELAGATKGSIGAALERLGAKLVKKVSANLDLLIVGSAPGFDAIDAMDQGVPFLDAGALDALLAGAPLSDFVAPPGPAVADPAGRVREILTSIHDALVSLETGERWEETLTVTVRADARTVATLKHLGGTPLHDHVRKVIQRQSWPKVSTDVTVAVPIVFDR